MLLIAIVIFTLIGCAAGTLTGLVPGLHVNNIAHVVLVSESALIALATTLFGWCGPSTGEILILISSLVQASKVRARRRHREETESARLQVFVRYLSQNPERGSSAAPLTEAPGLDEAGG